MGMLLKAGLRGALVLILAGVAGGAVIPVPGGSLEAKGGKDGEALLLPKWSLVEGKNEDCTVWSTGERNGWLLQPGVVVETMVKVPDLSEKEVAVKGDWTGILQLDYLGTSTGGRATLGLEVAVGDEVLAREELSASGPKVPKEAAGTEVPRKRLWVIVPPERMAALIGKEATIRVRVAGADGMVGSGVSFCRVSSQPSARLFGRSNGGLGPDQLGAGSLGFDGMTEHKQHALPVMNVRKDGPAERAGMEVGDVILDVNREPLPENDLAPGWGWLEHSHEAVLGHAVLEGHRHRGVVELGILRKGKLKRLELKVARAMNFTSMNPAGDVVAADLHRDMIGFLVRTQRDDGSWSGDPIRTTFSALALLATRDATHAGRVKQAVDYLLNRYPEAENFGNLGFWHSAYAGILYSEYLLATGDTRVLPRLEDIRDWALTGTHTSKWGMPALGHGIGGLPYGQKALMAPLAHLVVYEALATRGGMASGIWEELFPYIEYSWSDPARTNGKGKPGHGAMGYNASYKDLGEFWSRSGLCAMACHLRGERPDMRDGMVKVMRERHPWIRNSHAYGEPGGSWGLLGLNLCAPEAHAEVMAAYAWWFALAWEPGYGLRFTTPHMGAPYMGTDDLVNATYALVLAAPKRTLHLTGATDRNWLDVSGLPTAVSEVRLKRNKDGVVTMAGRIPGPELRYTVDGSTPGENSLKYTEPIEFAQAGTIRARVISDDRKDGPVGEWTLAPAKVKWQVVAASGHADQPEALRRAARAIDGDPNRCWLTDGGQDAAGYPHFLVIDMGESTKLNGLTVQFGHQAKAPGKWIVKTSANADEKPVTVAEGEWGEFATSRDIEFTEPVEARFLRFEAVTGLGEGTNTLMVRELDVQ